MEEEVEEGRRSSLGGGLVVFFDQILKEKKRNFFFFPLLSNMYRDGKYTLNYDQKYSISTRCPPFSKFSSFFFGAQKKKKKNCYSSYKYIKLSFFLHVQVHTFIE